MAIDGDYVNSGQETILERIFDKVENDASDTLAIIWSVEDVQIVRPDLSEQQSMEVLKEPVNNHDANIGVNWDTLKDDADQLFPMPHPNHCGKPCAECVIPCELDESTPCSPDCEGIGNKELCIGCDAKEEHNEN